MNKNFLFALILLTLTLSLSACAPERDPRNIADAYATQAEADRLNEQVEYQLQQQAITDEIANQEAQTRLEIFQATKTRLIESAHTAINILTICVIAAAGYFILQSSRTAVDITRRMGEATAAALELRASLIPLSAKTRTYPLQITQVDGDWFATNHSIGAVYRIDQGGQPPNPQMIAALAAVQQTGLLAMEARKSKGKAGRAASFAQISPELITAETMTGELA